MVTLLFLRPDDHVILGVRWSGLVLTGGAAGVPLMLEATVDDARLLLVLPPQHMAEQRSPAGSAPPSTRPTGLTGTGPVSVGVWPAVLSGPSQVAFAVERGRRLPLTLDGLLAALATSPLVRTAVAGSGRPDDTAIELPWGLLGVPTSPSAGGGPFCALPAGPSPSPDGATVLWRVRVVPAPGAAEPTIGLRLAENPAAAADPFPLPLPRPDRASIVSAARAHDATASRLELSALGGTLMADGQWETFAWEQRTVLGRDLRVRTVARGVLYPLGHRAEFLRCTERVIDPGAAGAAVLRAVDAIVVTEPVRTESGDAMTRRVFPFDQVELTTRLFTQMREPAWLSFPLPGAPPGLPTHFQPTGLDGRPLRFPIVCITSNGPVHTGIPVHADIPLIFVRDHSPQVSSLTDPGLARALADLYGEVTVPLPAVPLDLVRAPSPRDGDTHEVLAMTIGGIEKVPDVGNRLAGLASDGYRPALTALRIAMPALRTLLGDSTPRQVRLAPGFLRNGPSEDVLLTVVGDPIGVSFARSADRSGGLVAPSYVADAISRSLGPVSLAGLPAPDTGLINPRALFDSAATVLGFPLRDLLSQLKLPPQITSRLGPGGAPEVTMRWTDVTLRSVGPFTALPGTRLDLTVDITAAGSATVCTIHDFALVLPPGSAALLRLSFGSLTFTQRPGRRPELDVEDVAAAFLGDLQLLQELEEAVDLGGAGRILDVRTTGIAVRYELPVPSVAAGAFLLSGIAVVLGVDVPFDGRPVAVSLGFSSRDRPFSLGVLMFGGGGYIDLRIDRDGLRRLEASLEFGAVVAVDFVIARGEVHALGGVRFILDADGSVTLTGYLRIGGSVEVLGLVSVSIEMRLELTYQSARRSMVGRATIVVEIDLTLWSDSVEIDSGEWVLAGGGSSAPPHAARLLALTAAAAAGGEPDPGLARWRAYRAAFAPDPTRGPA